MENENDLIDVISGWIERGEDLYTNKLSAIDYSRSPYLKIKKAIDNFISPLNPSAQFYIMPGLRGVGKTTLLLEGYRYLEQTKKIPKGRILQIDVNRLVEGFNSSLFEVFEVFEKHFLKEGYESLKTPLFFLIDEAHYDPKWDQATKVLSERSGKIFFIITGSSALRLASSDVERRSNVQHIFPLNFQEYVMIKYGIFPPKNSNIAQYVRKAIFELDTQKSYELLKTSWKRLKESFIPKIKDLETEIRDFLISGGFPFTVKNFDSHNSSADALVRSLDKVILDDIYPLLPMIKSTDSRRYFAILHCLVKSLGNPISNEKIFESLSPLINTRKRDSKLISSTSMVHNVIDALIKTKIIFPIKPFSSDEKVVRHAWEYYFTTSTIVSSLLIDMGKFHKDENTMWGKILENEVAAVLEKNRSLNVINNVQFDYNEGGADFIISNSESEKRVLEICTSGSKDEKQVMKTMAWCGATFGAIIGDYPEVEIKDNIIHIPKLLILMI